MHFLLVLENNIVVLTAIKTILKSFSYPDFSYLYILDSVAIIL